MQIALRDKPAILPTVMSWKQKFSGGVLGVIGFLLSPLSWWNDAFVNLPLALSFAWLVSFFYKPAFEISLVVGYWLTNVLGFVLMHKAGDRFFRKENKPYSRKDFFKDLAISLGYTLLILALIKWKVFRPVGNYFSQS